MSTQCNATLTTATVEPCQTPGRTGGMACLHPGCVTLDGVWHRVTLRTLACNGASPCPTVRPGGRHVFHDDHTEFYWTDSTPGAKPHEPPLVADAEVRAAMEEWTHGKGWMDDIRRAEEMRRALEAAARIRLGVDA